MKALILAGGRGTRLRPLTHTSNKHLLPVANQPMIMRIILDAIDIGARDIIININKGDTELPSALGDGSDLGVTFHYIEQEKPNGMMYPIKLAQDIIGDEEFLFSAGDNILAGGLQKHYKDFKKKGSDAHVLVVKRPDYHQFGVAVMEGDKVIDTVEKPKEFVSDLVLTAIYFFTPEVFRAFDKIKPIDPKGTGEPEYFPPTVINWMVKEGMYFSTSEVTGWWKDTGKPNDLLGANAFALEKKVDFQQKGNVENSTLEGNIEHCSGTVIENSVIRGPVAIGKNCMISNCYIGPYTSIADNCELVNTQIENSILMKEVTIHKPSWRIDSSIVGRGSEIENIDRLPTAVSVIIGDNSVVTM
jgi:glucose-1-phosphate thymidylyltransferase